METMPSQSEVLSTLNKLIDAGKNLEQSVLPNFNQRIEELDKNLQAHQKMTEDLKRTMEEILPNVRNEVERMTSYNQGLHQLFNERLEGIKQDIEGLRRQDIGNLTLLLNERLEGVKQDIEGLRRQDIGNLTLLLNERLQSLKTEINERLEGVKQDIEGLRRQDIGNLTLLLNERLQSLKIEINEFAQKAPTIEQIQEKLVSEQSPLATKREMLEIERKLSRVEGYAQANLLAVIGTLIAVIVGISTISRNLQPLQKPAPNLSASPQQTTPSKSTSSP